MGVKPKSCHGNEHSGYRHCPKCRRGRPQCAAMRKTNPKRKPCGCDAYHFPHRAGSGRCGNLEKQWAHIYGPEYDLPF